MDSATNNKEIKMKNVTNSKVWTTKSGTKVEITSGLTLKKSIYCDGDRITVDCCEKYFFAKINGKPIRSAFFTQVGYPKVVNGREVLASIGQNVYLSDPNDVKIVKKMIAKTESHPAWIEKMATFEKNEKEIDAFDASRRASGYCEKCGSYCYGDCEAA